MFFPRRFFRCLSNHLTVLSSESVATGATGAASASGTVDRSDGGITDENGLIDGIPFQEDGIPKDITCRYLFGTKGRTVKCWKWYLDIIPPVSKAEWMEKHSGRKQLRSAVDLKKSICTLCLARDKVNIVHWKWTTWFKSAGNYTKNNSNAKKHLWRHHREQDEVGEYLKNFSDEREYRLVAALSMMASTDHSLRGRAMRGDKEQFMLATNDLISMWLLNTNVPYSIVNNDEFAQLLNHFCLDVKTMSRETFVDIVDAKFNMVSFVFYCCQILSDCV